MAEEIVEVEVGAEETQRAAGQRGRGAMRWNNVSSCFVLRRMSQLISTGIRTDKGFKEIYLNKVAKDIQEFSGNEVTGTHMYNHLCKCRQRWIKVSKLRELSGANWNEDNYMIVLEQEHFKDHVQAYPKDADYLNKPIESYQQMITIFGSGMTTGRFFMGSNEPLGSLSDFAAESSMKLDMFDEERATNVVDDVAKVFGDKPKNENTTSVSRVGNKRKRAMLGEDTIVLANTVDVVNNVATTIRETKTEEVHHELYGAVMYMPRFTEDTLIAAFSHPVDNKAQGTAFVGMSEAQSVL